MYLGSNDLGLSARNNAVLRVPPIEKPPHAAHACRNDVSFFELSAWTRGDESGALDA